MPRISHLAAAVALGLAANAAQAQQFTNVIVFGDSLSDAGQYQDNVPGAEGSFTTNPDPVAAELIADFYGIDLTASNFGGFDYAFGGAQTHDPIPGLPLPFCVSGLPAPGLPCSSMTTQLGMYLARTNNTVDPNALYMVWGGGNDLFFNAARTGFNPAHPLFITPAQAQLNMQGAAIAELGIIGALQAGGARYIVVYNLPDVGRSPGGIASGNPGGATGLALVFNAALNAGLAQMGDGIIPVDSFGLINEVMNDFQSYGFTNVTGTACAPELSVLFCSDVDLVSPDANDTYLFADGSHPTGAAHRLLAEAVVAEIAAPGQVSMLGEAALTAHSDHLDSLSAQMWDAVDDSRADDSVRGYADIKFGRSDYDASGWSPQTDIDQTTLTAGADFRANTNWHWGGAVSVSKQQMDAGSSDVDGTSVAGSLYALYDFGHAYLDATATLGTDSFDIDRHILLGTMNRVERGSTDASHSGFAVGGGLVFGSDHFKHGPFADVTWTNVDVDDFIEESGDSTSMHFDSYDRDSMIGRIGYRLQGTAGSVKPFANVAYNHESEDDQVEVRAGLNTMAGNFVMPGFTPTDNWWTAEVGVGFDISDRTSMFVSYSGLFANDIQDRNTLTLGVRSDLGSHAEAVVPEPTEAAPDCSTLDDDADGVSNCDDQCPGTAAGEAVGPNGCAMPAPEVLPEPKPFRQ